VKSSAVGDGEQQSRVVKCMSVKVERLTSVLLVCQYTDGWLISSVMMNEASSWPENSGVKKAGGYGNLENRVENEVEEWISQVVARDNAYVWRGLAFLVILWRRLFRVVLLKQRQCEDGFY
jgi:hypothetical protein